MPNASHASRDRGDSARQNEPLLSSIKAAGARLGGVSPSSVYGLIRSGQLRAVRLGGGRTMIVDSDLRSFVDRLVSDCPVTLGPPKPRA
jgi:hypothetical protein